MKRNLKYISCLLLIVFTCFLTAQSQAQGKRILVFSKTAGFYHASIPVGIKALQKLGESQRFMVDTTKDASQFNAQNLKKYSAVVFLNTTGDVLNDNEQQAFEQYIKAGGGFVGIHAATDTEYEWPWYGQLVGAYFVKHPEQQIATLKVVDKKTIATQHLPEKWVRKDEWYNFKNIQPDLKVLIEIDESTYKGGSNGKHHPMAWYRDFDGGRSFYTELGHVDESYADPLYINHLLGGLEYAMGVKPMAVK